MAWPHAAFAGIGKLLFATTFEDSQEWHATKECVRRQKKKGVRLWLFAMAKG